MSGAEILHPACNHAGVGPTALVFLQANLVVAGAPCSQGCPMAPTAAAPQDLRLPGSPGMWGRLTETSPRPTFDS